MSKARHHPQRLKPTKTLLPVSSFLLLLGSALDRIARSLRLGRFQLRIAVDQSLRAGHDEGRVISDPQVGFTQRRVTHRRHARSPDLGSNTVFFRALPYRGRRATNAQSGDKLAVDFSPSQVGASITSTTRPTTPAPRGSALSIEVRGSPEHACASSTINAAARPSRCLMPMRAGRTASTF